ncbi:carboxypeptidase regulatory-like domain-containing protein [Myxococcus xanthus]|uniref:carboxypeptidase regulatory-like domain-containing protein n=1 Tax=Myxococcus xanthus TaxID=34 RepID=UPI001F1C305B|nr:carboxypeptidase regulatory-like domain-containing protein [Myxococcus xanthus]
MRLARTSWLWALLLALSACTSDSPAPTSDAGTQPHDSGTQLGRVTGQALLEGESHHEGTTVVLSGVSDSVTTDAQGRFTFDNVPTGTHTVAAIRSNYEQAGDTLEVHPGQTTSVDLSLSRRQEALVLEAPALTVQRGHLKLTGSGFGEARGTSRVSIGGVDAEEYLSWSDTEVVVRVPGNLVPGEQEVVVTPGVDWKPAATASLRVLRQRTLAHAANWGIGVLPNNTVTVWGSAGSLNDVTPTPAGLSDVVSVGAGMTFAVALQADGTLVKWGGPDPVPVPAGLSDVVDISATGVLVLALKRDGTVVAIGAEIDQQTHVPEGLQDVVAVSAGAYHGMALKADGTLTVWGQDVFDLLVVPADLDDAVAIANTSSSALALRANGTAAVWGFGAAYYDLALTPDLSDVVDVAGGEHHYMALRSNGTVVAWGNGAFGQTTLPAGLTDVAAVAGQAFNKSLALRRNGTIAAWGDTSSAWTLPPPGLVLRVPAR